MPEQHNSRAGCENDAYGMTYCQSLVSTAEVGGQHISRGGFETAAHGRTYRQSFVSIVEVGEVCDPGAVPGHLVPVEQETAKQQKHHDG